MTLLPFLLRLVMRVMIVFYEDKWLVPLKLLAVWPNNCARGGMTEMLTTEMTAL